MVLLALWPRTLGEEYHLSNLGHSGAVHRVTDRCSLSSLMLLHIPPGSLDYLSCWLPYWWVSITLSTALVQALSTALVQLNCGSSITGMALLWKPSVTQEGWRQGMKGWRPYWAVYGDCLPNKSSAWVCALCLSPTPFVSLSFLSNHSTAGGRDLPSHTMRLLQEHVNGHAY